MSDDTTTVVEKPKRKKPLPTLHPHRFFTRMVDLFGSAPLFGGNRIHPRVFITPEALQKFQVLTDLVTSEIGWRATCYRLEEGGWDFLITDAFLIAQTVTGPQQTCITPEGEYAFVEELMAKGEEGLEILNNSLCWMHSHAEAPTFPSVDDEMQMYAIHLEDNPPFYLRGITNRRGEMRFTLFDFENERRFDDVPWLVHAERPEELIDALRGEIAEKVVEAPWQPPDKDLLRNFRASGWVGSSGRLESATGELPLDQVPRLIPAAGYGVSPRPVADSGSAGYRPYTRPATSRSNEESYDFLVNWKPEHASGAFIWMIGAMFWLAFCLLSFRWVRFLFKHRAVNSGTTPEPTVITIQDQASTREVDSPEEGKEGASRDTTPRDTTGT
ncbi:MAG: hypothetical protein KDD64_08770 [Bdellovibrionales bacterium]|nr:hypothetical protein [Bdellovibrionales bacterium]